MGYFNKNLYNPRLKHEIENVLHNAIISRDLFLIRSGYILSSAKKDIPGAHFERIEGSIEQNQLYCRKGGQWKDYGTVPRAKERTSSFGKALDLAE